MGKTRIELEIPFTENGCPFVPPAGMIKDAWYKRLGLPHRRAESDQYGRTLVVSRSEDERSAVVNYAAGAQRIFRELFMNVIWYPETHIPGREPLSGVAVRKEDLELGMDKFMLNEVNRSAREIQRFLRDPNFASHREGTVVVNDISASRHVPLSIALTDILREIQKNKDLFGRCVYPNLEGPPESMEFKDFLPAIIHDRLTTVLLALQNPNPPGSDVFVY